MTKTLVLVPAFGCDERLYAPQIAAFSDALRIQTIVPDADTYQGMVEQILAKAPQRFAILGTSMGGRAALETALVAPDRVSALGIIGAAAGAVADKAAGLLRSTRIRGGGHAAVIAEMAEMIAHEPGRLGPHTKQAFIDMGLAVESEVLARQSDALAARIDCWDAVKHIACPTLCLWGVHDQFSPTADGKRLSQAVRNGTYVEIPDCGHFPTLERPDESTEAIRRWLSVSGTISSS